MTCSLEIVVISTQVFLGLNFVNERSLAINRTIGFDL
jgi:hypothetical protein